MEIALLLAQQIAQLFLILFCPGITDAYLFGSCTAAQPSRGHRTTTTA